jgi:hypothetical protein
MSKIFIRIDSKIHRALLNNFKFKKSIKTDTCAIMELIEVQKLQILEIETLKNQLKILKIRMYKKD